MKRFYFLWLIYPFFLINSFCQDATISIDPETQYQVIEGFGAHGSMDVYWHSGPFYNSEFLDLVIDTLGLTMNRNSYQPGDEDFYNKTDYFRAIRQKAENSGEPLKFISTIWSPPAQWKINNSTTGTDTETNRLRTIYYDEYAEYCADIVKFYKDSAGIDLYAFSLANEPNYAQTFNSCVWDPDDYADMVTLVGEEYDARGYSTQTFGVEDMGSFGKNTSWFNAILKNDTAREHHDIWAVHGYQDGVAADYGDADGWSNMSNTVSSYGKQLWMTETSGYVSTKYFENAYGGGAFDLAKSIYLALKFGRVSAWVWWQLCEPHHTNWYDDRYSLMYLEGGNTPVPSKLFYVSRHYYRYVRPGAYQVASSSDNTDVLVTAFKHGDDSRLTVILINNASDERTAGIDMPNLPASFKLYRTTENNDWQSLGTVNPNSLTLPAKSINTLVYEGSNHAPTINQVNDTIILDPAQVTIDLSNISNGGDGGQQIGISVTNTNPTLHPDLNLNYTQGDATGTLTFSPASGQSGLDTINILLEDDGDNTGYMHQTMISFRVRIVPFINTPPTVDVPNDTTIAFDQGWKYLTLTGVNDGDDGSQNVNFTVSSSDENIIKYPGIVYSGGNTAKLNYMVYDTGTATITVTLKDDGGTYLGGTNKNKMSFNITVKEGLDIKKSYAASRVDLDIYPNPADKVLNIEIPVIGECTISLTNSIGGVVRMQHMNSSGQVIKMPVNNLPQGLYFVIVDVNGKQYRATCVIN